MRLRTILILTGFDCLVLVIAVALATNYFAVGNTLGWIWTLAAGLWAGIIVFQVARAYWIGRLERR